jgi:hypothetical protein
MAPPAQNMRLFIGQGLGLTWQEGPTAPVEAVPVVLEEGRTITLDDPDSNYDRWDLIVLRPNEFYDEYAQRSVRNRDGTLTVQNLPGIMNADAQIVVIKGTPSTDPLVPDANVGDIVVAAVKVPAGNPAPILADNIYDTRIYLGDSEGSVMEYYCVVKGGATYTIHHESTSTRNIRITQSMHRGGVGNVEAYISIPRVLGSHMREIVDMTNPYSIGIVTASIGGAFTGMKIPWPVVLRWDTSMSNLIANVLINVDILDTSGSRIDLGDGEVLYVHAVFPRVD